MPNVVFSLALYCKSLQETEDSAPFQTYLTGIQEVCLALQDVVSETDWEPRIALYTDQSVPKREKTALLRRLRKIWMNGQKLLQVDDHSFNEKWTGSGGMLARFRAFSDYSSADAVFSIDADLRQDTLWRRAFRDFLIGNEQVFRAALLDYYKSPNENTFSMCAGLLGIKGEALRLWGNEIGSKSTEWLATSNKEYGCDQMFLGAIAWPLLRDSTILTVQMVTWHPAEEMPLEWKGSNEKIWENSQFSTLSMI
jgi:hypothetical protein